MEAFQADFTAEQPKRVMTAPSHADTIQLYAAGSLRAALTDAAKAFEAETGNYVQAKYGPSGILKDEIAGGAKADVICCRA